METWKRNFGLIWTANFITALGMMAFLPLLPLHLQRMGVGDAAAVRLWSGVLIGAAPFVAAFMGPFWGTLGDRVGCKPMIVRANLAIMVFVGLMALATTPVQLLVLRLGQGLLSGYMAPSLTLVSVTTPVERQGRVVGLLQTSIIAGMMTGPILGGLIGDTIGFSAIFLVTAALSGLAALLVGVAVKEPVRAVSGGEADAEASAAATGGLMAAVRRDLAAVLTGGPLRMILLTVFTVRLGAALVDPILALFVQTLKGVDEARVATLSGLVVGARAVTTLMLTAWWGRLGDGYGHGRLLALCALGTGLCTLPQALAQDVTTLFVLRLLSGAFLAGVVPVAYALAARHSTVERRGGAYGLTFSSLGFAYAIGPVTGGGIAAGFGLRAVFVVAAALMLGASLAAYLGRRRRVRSRAA